MAACSLKPSTSIALRPLRLPRPFSKSSKPTLFSISCGPRDHRWPLLRGRTLSTEAILAVQALKRALDDDSKVEQVVSTAFVRLLKPDLVAALAELRRQGQWRLAGKVFVAARKEFSSNPDYSLYAAMVAAMARNGMREEIGLLVSDLLAEREKGDGFSADDIRGLARVVQALIGVGSGKAVKYMYREMKRRNCVPNEFLFKDLMRGLRGLGEGEAADDVERDFEVWSNGGSRSELLRV
ncbi:protein THYLAKOID ASSEMBLY 8, chloroplastic [Elaeis guineensis]|uniref:Protein THYLAKOID ASSEMBLY 8, chloroplastic n=1 Tax=Elaeis guineensis var. tenera TaxID=51953 RepID=A0A6I9R9F6_ELAGV|nr:protein THYLAKOID ASSEMBLY 8, chloroplastic [Elaeis guineensis]